MTRYARGVVIAAAVLASSTWAHAQAPAAPSDPAAPPAAAPADPAAPAAAPAPEPATKAPAPVLDPTELRASGTPPQASTTTFPTMSNNYLRLSELFSIRFGIQLQLWASLAQDAIPKANGDAGGYTKNIYLRRARFFIGGGFSERISYLLLWESANLGLPTANADGSTNKNFATWSFNDAFLDFKINKNVSVQGGLMLIPFTRNILQSTGTYWPIDIASVSATYIAATQTQTLRDTGVEVKINALDGKLEARAMVSQGIRLADAAGMGRGAGKNDPRYTGYLQYNFLDAETGYVFNGQYFGRKKVAGIALGADYQDTVGANPYFATSATAYAAIPVNGADPKKGGDEVGGQVEYLHFHNGRLPLAAIAQQDDVYVDLGYYNRDAKLSVFGKFEGRFFDSGIVIGPGVTLDVNNTRLYGGGVKYFFAEAAANLTLQYSYTQFPNQPSTARNSTNTIQAQLQLAYF